jgi:rfaE bifunctional protein kinase chain/domain
MISLARLEALLAQFPRLTIGLVGDLFLDRYLEIDTAVREISVETDLEAYQVRGVRNSPGALGTVMNNLSALGAGRLVPVSVVGDDGHAFDLFQALGKLPVDPRHVLREPSRLTPTYTKPMHGQRELNRLDVKSRCPLEGPVVGRVMERVRQVFAETDGLIVLDQVSEEGWGVVGREVRDLLAQLQASAPEKLIFIDSRAHVGKFPCGTLKPNLPECLRAVGLPADAGDTAARGAAVEISRRSGRPLFCTLGEKGMLVVRPQGDPVAVPGFPVSGPIDVVGAGDSATSGIVAALLSGATDLEAATVGNLVASITVQQIGTTGTASPAQVVARWRETHTGK